MKMKDLKLLNSDELKNKIFSLKKDLFDVCQYNNNYKLKNIKRYYSSYKCF